MALSDDIKATVSLKAEVEAMGLTADRAASNPRRGDFAFPCPLHGNASPSFRVFERPGEVPGFYCHGCAAKGTVIDLVMGAEGLTFAAAVDRLARAHGIGRDAPDADTVAARERAAAKRRAAQAEAMAQEARDATANARDTWRRARPVQGAAGAILCNYLEARTGRPGTPPPSLRIAPRLKAWAPPENPADGPVEVYNGPAMVAAVGRRATGFVGVHRTWITETGRARMADGVKVPKQMRGPCFGAPVMLTPAYADSLLVVGEGIETTLAVAWRLQDPAHPLWDRLDLPDAWRTRGVTAEAALSLPSLAGGEAAPRTPREGRAPLASTEPDPGNPGWLPPEGHRGPVLILADPSAKDPDAARNHATRARAKLQARGVETALAVPHDTWSSAADFADLAATGDLDA